MDYHRVNVGADGKTYFRKKSRVARTLADVPRVRPRDGFSQVDNYFVLEQALVDGTLPDPSLAWEQTRRWIAPYQWDMLIYMWSNADISKTSESFSGLKAAYTYTGLNRGVHERKEQTRRKLSLFSGLEQAGLMEVVRTVSTKTYRQLKLAPVWLPDGPAPSGIARTWANLEASERKWFKMAMHPFTRPSTRPSRGKTPRCEWATLEHVDKRALAALYLFFNDKEFGAVDPNHVCLRGNYLVLSEAFRRAVGRKAEIASVPEALGELHRLQLIGFMDATFTEDKPYPGSPAHIRYATPDSDSQDAVVVLKYVPRPEEPVA